ncbi:MAG: hypothetical protein H0W78_05125 [Planctomycetes bacterium]|nr:hypothetical protein [Planctomycetota bacterium]
MNKHLALPLVFAFCCAVVAEDQPVPPPPPTTDPTVPVPPPPPTTDPTAPAPPAPSTVDAPASAPTPPAPARGDRVAAAAGRAAAQGRAKAVSLRLEVDAGYDTNVLREDTTTATSTDTEGFALGSELRGTWRAIRNQQGQLNFIGEARYNYYPDESSADLGRIGAAAFGLLRLGGIDPGMVIGVNRQWIDGEGIATILRGTLTVTRLSPGRAHFDSLSFDAYDVSYDDNDAASGVFSDLLWRHWWMPEAGNARRRVEFTLQGGFYSAEADVESYTMFKPGIGILYRLGDQESGVWDISAQTALELRSYDEGITGESAEDQTNWQIGASVDRWFGSWFAAGPFITYSLRESTRDARDYDRVQVGVRLIADW